MRKIEIYGQKACSYCIKAIHFAGENQLPFVYRDIADSSAREEMFRRNPAATTVPQIFIGETLIGGFTELEQTPISQIQQMIGE